MKDERWNMCRAVYVEKQATHAAQCARRNLRGAIRPAEHEVANSTARAMPTRNLVCKTHAAAIAMSAALWL
eukprot:6465768-Pyramimonas_sp.AAC.1